MDQPLIPAGYGALLEELKTKIRAARIKLAYAANRGLITLYWNIGRTIVERQKTEGWGRSAVVRLGQDLQKEFPGQKGFSAQNIWFMRSFYLAWNEPLLSQPATEIEIISPPEEETAILLQPVREFPRGRPSELWTSHLIKEIERGASSARISCPTSFPPST